jgi:hypothetical protein
MPKNRKRRKLVTQERLHGEADKARKAQWEEFRKKFRRDPVEGDPMLFDPNSVVPVPYPIEKLQAEMVGAMRKAGMPPQFVYAFKKTGLLLIEGNGAPPHIRKNWEGAIAEYFELERRAARDRWG